MEVAKSPTKNRPNNLKHYREQQLMSKAELSRRAGISVITIGRVEEGLPCRLDTKRKIILALGLRLMDKGKIFKD
jgi:DNA-binding XRE family transcriptional regulator